VFRFAKKSRFLIALVCVALLALRVGGLHAHLCLDGAEPPISFHVADSGVHHLDPLAEAEDHADRDVSIASDIVLKKPFGDLDLSLVAAFGAVLLFLFARRRELPPLSPQPIRVRSSSPRLRPPLRGPPR